MVIVVCSRLLLLVHARLLSQIAASLAASPEQLAEAQVFRKPRRLSSRGAAEQSVGLKRCLAARLSFADLQQFEVVVVPTLMPICNDRLSCC